MSLRKTMYTKQHISQRLAEIKNNLANWEKWFEVRVYDQHKCAMSEEHVDTDILYVSSPESDSALDWAMARIWLAGTKEVRNGEASEVGELVSLSLIEINYCPQHNHSLQSDRAYGFAKIRRHKNISSFFMHKGVPCR
jgi:hypothetical protein